MNIYTYTTRDGRKMAFMFIGFIIIFTCADFMGAAYVYNDPLLVFYGLLFRIFILVPYIFLSSKAYYYFRYSSWVMIAIAIPTLFWAILTFMKAFGLFYTLAIVAFFILGMMEIQYREKQKEYDYKKSAKELLKEYPNPITVKARNFLDKFEKKKKSNTEKNNKVLSLIMRFVPPWSIFAIPSIVGTISSLYLGFGGLVVAGMFASVVGNFLLIGISLNSYRYRYVFEEAQKILDEKSTKNK